MSPNPSPEEIAAWKRYADACLEHDCLLGLRACQDLQALAALIPDPRCPAPADSHQEA